MTLSVEQKHYCEDLLYFKSLNSGYEYLRLQLELLFDMIGQHHKDPIEGGQAEADARMCLQMYFSRLLNFSSVLRGVSFARKNRHLNTIIDPSVLFTETRGLFESLSVFELVFVIPNTKEKSVLMHQLFTIAGLQERQQMHITNKEFTSRLSQEKKELDMLINDVRNSSLYSSLDAKNKKKIDECIKRRQFRIYIDDQTDIVDVGWDKSREYYGLESPLFDDMYRYFSLHAHPSVIAIRQFAFAFQKDTMEFVNLANTAVHFAVAISSVFIADYIRKYPNVQSTFDALCPYQQMLIDYYNRLIRGEQYAIFADIN